MRLRLLTAVGALALALAVPSAALARHGGGHHHHKGHHSKAHHARFHFLHIGARGAAGPAGPSGPTGPTGPSGPTGPTGPENAATVTSYSTTTNMLELTLTDKSTVSGKVTSDTRIECVSATPSAEPGGEGPGDDSGQGDDQSRGDMSQGDQSGEDWSWGDHKDGGDDDGEVGIAEPPCDTSALVPGAVVRAAELRIGPSGNEFESIVLVR